MRYAGDESDHPQLKKRISLLPESLNIPLPKRLRKKRSLVGFLLLVLSITTIGMLVVSCLYAAISGNSRHWYNTPESWQFCVVYADHTTQLWDRKVVDGIAPSLGYLGLVNTIFTWAALASTFRALYNYDWIPSTMVFLGFNIFGQLCYYQSNLLIVLPARLVTSLLVATTWVSSDMYDNLGKFCSESEFSLGFENEQLAGLLPPPISGDVLPKTFPNCTDSVVLITDRVIESTDKTEQIELLTNSTVLNSDLNCGGAVALHVVFLVLSYVLVAITATLFVILWRADRDIRANRPLNHYFRHPSHSLKGGLICVACVSLASVGFIMTSMGNLDASVVALEAAKDYHLVAETTAISEVKSTETAQFGEFTVDVEFDVKVNFFVNTYLPFKINQLNLVTVLLIASCMFVARGQCKQSVFAFKVAAVASLLGSIVQWPVIVGNVIAFNKARLWWWQSSTHCAEQHSGIAFFDPTSDQSDSFCSDSRWSMAGALVTFIALHANIAACAFVSQSNSHRESLEVLSSVDTSMLGEEKLARSLYGASHSEVQYEADSSGYLWDDSVEGRRTETPSVSSGANSSIRTNSKKGSALMSGSDYRASLI